MPFGYGQPGPVATSGECRAIMFTDVVGSTALWAEDPVAMDIALRRHDLVVLASIQAGHGDVFANPGDSFGASFPAVAGAVQVAGAVLDGLENADLPLDISVRIGIHWGEVICRRGNLFGLAVSLASRLASAAHPDEILISSTAAAQLPRASSWSARRLDLRGVPTPINARAVEPTAV